MLIFSRRRNVPSGDKELVDFFRTRTLDDAELKKLEAEGDRLLHGDVNERADAAGS